MSDMLHHEIRERISRLQQALAKQKVDALLVTQPENRLYLSGYTGADHGIQESAGALLIPAKGRPALLTDSRFTLQAEAEAPDYTIITYQRGLVSELEQVLPDMAIRSLLFETDYLLVSVHQRLLDLAKKLSFDLRPQTAMIEEMRMIKSPAELDLLRQSSRLNEQVFQEVFARIAPGMTEREIALELDLTMRRLGAQGPCFDTIVAFGDNAAKPHAVPGNRPLREGEAVMIDMGLIQQHYCSDMTRTFVAGKADTVFLERHRLVRLAMLTGIQAIRAGVSCAQVDQAARKVLIDAGYGDNFNHSLGHGVGLAVHEEPRLSPRSERILQAGMVVTVEPGLYIKDWGGIRLENMVIVREEGYEVINADSTWLDI